MQQGHLLRPRWKSVLGVLITLALMVQYGMFWPATAQAATTIVNVTSATTESGQVADPLVVTFTTESGFDVGAQISLVLPDGLDPTISPAFVTVSAGGAPENPTDGFSATSASLTFLSPVAAAAATPVTVTIGDANAGFFTNPAPGSYSVCVSTGADSSGDCPDYTVPSPSMTISPAQAVYDVSYTGATLSVSLTDASFGKDAGGNLTTTAVLTGKNGPVNTGVSVSVTGEKAATVTLAQTVPADGYVLSLTTLAGEAIQTFELFPTIGTETFFGAVAVGQINSFAAMVRGTQFAPSPAITLRDSAHATVPGAGIAVDTSDHSMAVITLPGSLGLGHYDFEVDTIGHLTAIGGVDVVPALVFSGSASSATDVTTDSLTIYVTAGTGANFDATTTVFLEGASGATVSGSGTQATITLPSGLSEGTHLVALLTGSDRAIGALAVKAAPAPAASVTLSPNKEFYLPVFTGATFTALPQNTTFDTGSEPFFTVRDSAGQTSTGFSVTASSAGSATIAVASTAKADRYTLTFATAAGPLPATYDLNPTLGTNLYMEALPVGQYSSMVGVNVFGTTFGTSIAVASATGGTTDWSVSPFEAAPSPNAILQVPPDLSIGHYDFTLTTSTLDAQGGFDVVPALKFSADPVNDVQVTAATTTIYVTGLSTNFVQGSSVLQVGNAGTETLTVTAADKAHFTPSQPFGAGSYWMNVRTGTETATGVMSVADAPVPTPSVSLGQPAHWYRILSDAFAFTATPANTTFNTSGTLLTVLDSSNQPASGFTVNGSSATEATVEVASTVPAGSYTLQFATAAGSVETPFAFAPLLTTTDLYQGGLPVGQYNPMIGWTLNGDTFGASIAVASATGGTTGWSASPSADPHKAILQVPSELGIGHYEFTLTTASGAAAPGSFDVLPSLTFSADPTNAVDVTDQTTVIYVTGNGTNFTAGQTDFFVGYMNMAAATVTSATTATVTLSSPLGTGGKWITMQTGSAVAIGVIEPVAAPAVSIGLSQTTIYKGYSGQTLTVTGTTYTSQPALRILQGTNQVATASDIVLDGSGNATISLADGLDVGTYTVEITPVAGSPVTTTFSVVMPTINPGSVSIRYQTPGITSNLTGTGTRWVQGTTALTISGVTTTSSITVTDLTQATISWATDLPVGIYDAHVTTGDMTQTFTLKVAPTLSSTLLYGVVPEGVTGYLVHFTLKGSTLPADLTGWSITDSQGTDVTGSGDKLRLNDTAVDVVLPLLPVGHYNVTFPTTAGIGALGGFDVVPVAAVTPGQLSEGQVAGRLIEISSTAAHFVSSGTGSTTVDLRSPSGQQLFSGFILNVTGANSANIAFTSDLATGTYKFYLRTGTGPVETIMGSFRVSSTNLTLSPSTFYEGYLGQILVVSGHNFAPNTQPQLHLVKGEADVTGASSATADATGAATIALDDGLTAGVYSAILTEGGLNFTATFTVQAPAMTLDMSEVPFDVGIDIGMYGDGTRWLSGANLKITNLQGTQVPTGSTLSVEQDDRATIHLAGDLPAGQYKVVITTGTVSVSDTLSIYPPLGVWLNYGVLPEGYATGTEVHFDVFGSTFTTPPVLRIIDKDDNNVTGSSTWSLTTNGELDLSLNDSLPVGHYRILVTTASGVDAEGGIEIGPVVTLSPETLAAGYEATAIDISNPVTHFEAGVTRIDMRAKNGQSIDLTGSTFAVTDAHDATLTLGAGLPAGLYTLYLRTSWQETAIGWLEVLGEPSVEFTQQGGDTIGVGYPAGLEIALKGTNTHFADGTLLTITDSAVADALPEGTTLAVDPNTQEAFVTLGAGLTAGDYTLTFTSGAEVVQATLYVVEPSIQLSGDADWIRYDNENGAQITVDGTNTYFKDTPTTVTVLSPEGKAELSAYVVAISYNDRITIDLPGMLPVGWYTVQVSNAAGDLTAQFASQPGFGTYGDYVYPVGYPNGLSFKVVINGSTFGATSTVVIKNQQGQIVTPAGTSVQVLDAETARVTLGGGLPAGAYSYWLTDVFGIAGRNGFHIAPVMQPNPVQVRADYSAADQSNGITVTIPGVHYSGTTPVLDITDSHNRDYSTGTEAITVTDDGTNTTVTIALASGLAPGQYKLYLMNSNHGDRTMGYLQVGPAVSLNPASLSEGYEWPVTFSLTGDTTHFGATTTVELLWDNGDVAAWGQNIQVADATHLTFDLNQRLHGEEFKVVVSTNLTDRQETATGMLRVEPLPVNLEAMLRDSTGAAVKNVQVGIMPATHLGNWDYMFWAQTDASGMIRTGLRVGDYVVKFWDLYDADRNWVGRVDTSIAFTINSDPSLNPTELRQPAPNVTGVVTQGGTPVPNAELNIVPVAADGTRLWEQGVWVPTNAGGQYGVYLQPGTYVINSIKVGTAYHQWDETLVVSDTALTKDVILPVANFTGTVLMDNGVDPAFGTWVQIRSLDGTFATWAMTDADGNFAASLPTGSHFVAMVSKDDLTMEFKPDEYPIAVNAAGEATPASYTLTMKRPNVKFNVMDESGDAVQDGYIRINWTADGTLQERWARVAGGTAWAMLAEGSYEVTAISGPMWQEVSVLFTVPSADPVLVQPAGPNVSGTAVDENNKPVVNGWISFVSNTGIWKGAATDATGHFALSLKFSGTITSWRVASVGGPNVYYEPKQLALITAGVTDLVIHPDRPNVTGIVKDDSGTPLPDAWVAIGPAGTTSQTANWENGNVNWAQTRADGTFGITLPAGNYTVFQVWTRSTGFELQVNFAVTAGTPVTLTVQPPQPNVTGVALDDNGQPVASAWVGIRPAAAGDNEWQQFKWVQADAQGQFRLVLPAGDYVLRYVQTPNSWNEYHLAFTAGTNPIALVVRPPMKNIKGVVRDRNGQSMAIVNVAIRAEDGSASFWAGTDAQGAFLLVLPAGRYVAYGISTANRWIDTSLSFAAVDGVVTEIVVNEPRPNVTGTARDAGNNLVSGGWVAFQPAGAVGDWSRTVWVATNASGQFETTLAAGNWQVVNIQSPTRYYDLIVSGQTFSVTAGTATTLNVAPPTNNVAGTVYAQNGTTPLADAWVAIKPTGADRNDWSSAVWVQSNASGAFATALRTGIAYSVVAVYGPTVYYETNIPFTAPQAALAVKPPTSQVTGTLAIGAATAPNASLAIRPVVNGTVSDNPAETIWVEVKNGSWSLILSDGNYAVFAVDDGVGRYTGSSITVTQASTPVTTFTVSGGNATVQVNVTP